MESVNRHAATYTIGQLLIYATISLGLVFPFVILELITTRNLHAQFPAPLFAFMWALSFSLVVLVTSIVRSVRNQKMTNPYVLLPKVLLLAVVASVWIGLIADQLPCFLGVPNCD